MPRRAGVTGGVTAMPDFLAKFFPDIAAAQQAGPAPSAARQVQYCLFDDQGLQLFTSSLYLAGTASTLAGSYTSRCDLVFHCPCGPSSTVALHCQVSWAQMCTPSSAALWMCHESHACGSGRSPGDEVFSVHRASEVAPSNGI